MKKNIFILIISLILASCDILWDNAFLPPPNGFYTIAYDQCVSDQLQINIYAQQLSRAFHNEYAHYHWRNADDSVLQAIVSKDNLYIRFAPKVESASWESKPFANQNTYISKQTRTYEPFIPDYQSSYGTLFSFCRIDSPLSITADKSLFGRPAGSELNDMFTVTSSFPNITVSYPSFGVMDVPGFNEPAKDFFKPNTALVQPWEDNGFYELAFTNVPEEDYETLTLYFELCVTGLDIYNYFRLHEEELSGIWSFENESYSNPRIISGSTIIHFGKSVKENWVINGSEATLHS